MTAFPELISQIQPPIRTRWFAELIDIRAPERANEFVDFAIDALRSSMECADTSALSKRSRSRRIAALQTPRGASRRTRCSQHPKIFFGGARRSRNKNDILLTTHLAESREEMEMFRDASGPLYEFIKSIGRPMNDCGNETPLVLFLDLIR